jgi:hypothetical protein
MRKAIAERVHLRFLNDPEHEFDVAAGFLDRVTGDALEDGRSCRARVGQ